MTNDIVNSIEDIVLGFIGDVKTLEFFDLPEEEVKKELREWLGRNSQYLYNLDMAILKAMRETKGLR